MILQGHYLVLTHAILMNKRTKILKTIKKDNMALIIDIKVVTQSGKSVLMLDKSGTLKCFVKAVPEDGKANRELIQVVADVCKVTKKSVEIVSGLTSRKKRLAIDTPMNYEQFLLKLTGEFQKKIF